MIDLSFPRAGAHQEGGEIGPWLIPILFIEPAGRGEGTTMAPHHGRSPREKRRSNCICPSTMDHHQIPLFLDRHLAPWSSVPPTHALSPLLPTQQVRRRRAT